MRFGPSHLALRTLQLSSRRPLTTMSAGITEREKFEFDLNGFLVLRNVLSAEEVASANAAIDAHAAELQSRAPEPLRNAKRGTLHGADGPRLDMGGMIWWDKPHCDAFRRVLVHPKLIPYYEALCGRGYRLDHQPLVVQQERNSEGFALHGGPIQASGAFSPELQYRCGGGALWTSLLAVSVQLTDHGPGDGGFCVVRGSHKLNLPVPKAVAAGEDSAFADHLYSPVTRAGDVVIWSEATVHGARPWMGAHQRRIALYRFAPANMAYGRGYLEAPAASLATMSELERAVVEPPYGNRMERAYVTVEAAEAGEPPAKHARSAEKKEHDARIFGTSYF